MVKTRFFDENLSSSTTTLGVDSKITCARFIAEHHMNGIHYLLTFLLCLLIQKNVKQNQCENFILLLEIAESKR